MEREFNAAQKEIEDKIYSWYARFAENNEIDMAQARKMLNARELKELRWTLKEYISHAEESALNGQWVKQLENASARVHINRLEALQLEIQQKIESLYGRQHRTVTSHIADTYTETVSRGLFEVQRGFDVFWKVPKVDDKKLELLLSKPWTTDNTTFSSRIWNRKAELVNEVQKQLTGIALLGNAPDEAITAIAKKFKTSLSNAGRLVMSESAYFSAVADNDMFAGLNVEKYEVTVSFDGDTCDQCGSLDGKVFDLKDLIIGTTAPPFHANCRCVLVPYFDDEIQKTIDEKLGRAARDPKTGKTIRIKNMSYKEWQEKAA